MILSILKRAFILLVLFSLISCIDINGVNVFPNRKDKGVISATLNGDQFEVESGKGILASEFVVSEMKNRDDYFLLTIYGIRVKDGGKALAFGFKIAGINLEELARGSKFSEWNLIKNSEVNFEGAMGAVEMRKSVKSEGHLYQASSNHTGEMELIITDIDVNKKLISGRFSFTALDEVNGTLIEVENGTFDNIKWKWI
ncbi:hypothetical protein JYB62_03605 [Algoriphagus lutimaris]|uniref:hypothetical protein n=1 Tax=Algoriphagus lutimaris TaxID=613197 RepID=UPI00196B3075|nr:hypothetical protein [Algoriphagus lutimaris]MBN3519078.1 hypothetical protein [Algoriphagus lutimaris]